MVNLIHLVLIVNILQPINNKDTAIYWRSDYKLQNSDFANYYLPPSNSCGIEVNYEVSDIFIEYQAKAYWNKNSSRLDDYNNDISFAQLLFDLTEVYTRKLKKELYGLGKKINEVSIKNKLEIIKMQWLNEWSLIANETKKGTVTSKVQEWRLSINSMLLNLKEFETDKPVFISF